MLPAGIYIRKPCAPPVFEVLWAAVESDGSEPVRAPPAADGGLPTWVLGFQELNLKALCRKCVAELAPHLGYRDVSLYLHDRRRGLLTLAETTHSRAIDLAVPLTAADDHLMVAVSRHGRLLRTERVGEHLAAYGIAPHPDRQYPDETCLVAPLMHDDDLWGALNLSGRVPGGVADERPSLEEVFRFLGAALHHARAYDEVRTEARVDGLTGLYNQRWITETLEREIRRAQRFNMPLAALMIDLDGLKVVNDREGHAAGDCVLQHVASRISAVLRQFDGAARVGGDEFVVMLPATSLRGAQPVAHRLLQSIGQDPASYRDVPLRITASIGVAEWQPEWDARQLLEAADRAMYRAKQQGRNGMACETPERPAAARLGSGPRPDAPRADERGTVAGGPGFRPGSSVRGRPASKSAVAPNEAPSAAPPAPAGGEQPA
jgi:diguanylate cyclase (GGDEF)-like protein